MVYNMCERVGKCEWEYYCCIWYEVWMIELSVRSIYFWISKRWYILLWYCVFRKWVLGFRDGNDDVDLKWGWLF